MKNEESGYLATAKVVFFQSFMGENHAAYRTTIWGICKKQKETVGWGTLSFLPEAQSNGRDRPVGMGKFTENAVSELIVTWETWKDESGLLTLKDSGKTGWGGLSLQHSLVLVNEWLEGRKGQHTEQKTFPTEAEQQKARQNGACLLHVGNSENQHKLGKVGALRTQ